MTTTERALPPTSGARKGAKTSRRRKGKVTSSDAGIPSIALGPIRNLPSVDVPVLPVSAVVRSAISEWARLNLGRR